MSAQVLLPLVGLFLSVALAAALGTAYLLRHISLVERRLRTFSAAKAERLALSSLDLARPSYGGLAGVASALPKSLMNLSKIRRRMNAAGFERPEATVIYALAELILPVLCGAMTLLYFGWPGGLLYSAFTATVGYLLPSLWLGRRIAEHRKQIQNGLPDALDLLLVSMEAGSGLDQAFVKVGQELQFAYPALASEFHHVVTDIRAGRSRSEALRQFAERTKVDDIRMLVTTMIQTDKFGTSVGQALRTHAEVARTRRRQRAEERAQKLGVKLVFPLVFCLFPAMYVVVLGPAVLRIIRVLGSQLAK